MSKTEVVLTINPGSTSTKFALWSRESCIAEKVVRHERSQLAARVIDQFDYRRKLIDSELDPLLRDVRIVAVAGRGGPLKPIPGGTYSVNQVMLDDLSSARFADHASNLGAILSDYYARIHKVSAYVVDPVTVDEFQDVARLSGVNWCRRKSRSHALNIKAVVRRAEKELSLENGGSCFVVAHLGGGISIAAVEGGRIIDVNDALHGIGPYSPERAGALPVKALVDRCFDYDLSKEELLEELGRRGGLMSYLGTSDVREVLDRIKTGDKDAELALRGMIYQIAKEIGAMAAALHGKIEGVILTGGMAHSLEIIEMICPYIAFLERVIIYPAEGELQALAEGAFRVIDEVEEVKEYR